jgi:hypothetical protein
MLEPHERTVEWLLTSPEAFGVTSATPLQRAIARAIDGRPLGELWADPVVQRAFGGAKPPSGVVPHVFCIVAAIECAKTMLAAAKAIVASQTVSLEGRAIGDEIRIPVLATGKDTARPAYSHIVHTMMEKPKLRQLIIKQPESESVWVRHPTGRPIEITISALSRAGSTLVARRLPACIFDEAPRMSGDQEAVKNLDEALRAIRGRILPGGQIMLIGSPHAPFGPVYKLVAERFGRPSADCVVVRARGPDMNPYKWTPEECENLRRRDPDAWRTDCEALFADPEESLIPSAYVERAMRKGPLELEPKPGHHYVAAMDPGGRASAWTFLVLEGGHKGYRVAAARQWKKNAAGPVDARMALDEIEVLCRKYRITEVHSDQYAIEAISALANERGLSVLLTDLNADIRWKMGSTIRTMLEENELELPPVPDLREDLVRARKKVTSNGISVVLPTSGGGRHCDFFTALGLAVLNPPEPPEPERPEQKYDPILEQIDLRMNADAYEDAARLVA